VQTGFWWEGGGRKGTRPLDLGIDWRIIVKWIFKKWVWETWIGLIWLSIGTGDGHL
jgi:hypothetical protein